MINSLYGLVWLAILFIWGDWRNWKKYYPTILFFTLGDFLYLYLLSDHYPMWRYSPPAGDQELGLTNTHITFSIMLIKYPATVLAYLSHFPTGSLKKKLLYFFGWLLLYLTNEVVDLRFGLIEYFNGWSLWWSALFNSVMFLILKVHFEKPVFAWLLSAAFVLFLWNRFDVPSSVFR
jgi:hypothetical protein